MDNEWRTGYEEPSPPATDRLPPPPEGWCYVTIRQLKEFSLYGPRYSSEAYSSEGPLVLRTSDISEAGKVNLETAPRISISKADLEAYRVLRGDLLITRTGAQLGAWTRNSVPIDVLSVMAATLVGSIETLMTALGASSPREVSLMIDGRRVFVSKVNAQVVLVIVAAGGMTEVALRAAMRQIVKSLPPFPSDTV